MSDFDFGDDFTFGDTDDKPKKSGEQKKDSFDFGNDFNFDESPQQKKQNGKTEKDANSFDFGDDFDAAPAKPKAKPKKADDISLGESFFNGKTDDKPNKAAKDDFDFGDGSLFDDSKKEDAKPAKSS